FRVPICVAYIKLDNREYVAAHFSAIDPANAVVEPPDMAMLRQLAGAGEPLILPDFESHAVDRESAFGKRSAVRGFAGMPFSFERAEGSGALCLLDTHPLA